MPVLTIDLGGTSIKLGIVKNGSLIGATQIPADAKGKLEVNLERASEGLQNLLDSHHIQKTNLKELVFPSRALLIVFNIVLFPGM